jgi:hypothetical protein
LKRSKVCRAGVSQRPIGLGLWDVAVVSLEAKGPYCILNGHANGQILRLGDPSEFDDEETDE